MAVSRANGRIKGKNAEAALKAANPGLAERLKELNFIYSLSEIVDKHPDDLPAILKHLALILPAAFQFPEDARARVLFGNESYESKAFKATGRKLSVPISAKGGKRASVDVFYTKPHPFLREEEKLLRVFSERLGKVIERIGLAKALQAGNVRFSGLFESSNDAIFIADGETHKLVDCNKRAEELIGRPKAQILSMRADELHPKDRVKETMESFSKQARGELDITETEVLAKSGKRIPVEVNAAAFTAKGKSYLAGIFRDITAKKAADKLQQEYGAKLKKEVAERTFELETKVKQLQEFKEFAIGREQDLIALKKELEALKRTSGASRAAGQ